MIKYPGGLNIRHRRSLYTELAGDLLKPNSAEMVIDAQNQGLVLTKVWPRKVSLSLQDSFKEKKLTSLQNKNLIKKKKISRTGLWHSSPHQLHHNQTRQRALRSDRRDH